MNFQKLKEWFGIRSRAEKPVEEPDFSDLMALHVLRTGKPAIGHVTEEGNLVIVDIESEGFAKKGK